MPNISVIIPSHNHERYIGAAIESLLNQSYTDFELIIIDDGSTDGSRDVIQGYTDSRIKAVFQNNMDAYNAINRGIGIARGEYLAILNSDDIFEKEKLEICKAALDSSPETGMVSGRVQLVDLRGNTLSKGFLVGWYTNALDFYRSQPNVELALMNSNFILATSNVFFRRAIFERVGLFRPLRYAHDLDLYLRLLRISSITFLDRVLIRYRVHQANTIAENQQIVRYEVCWLIADHLYHRCLSLKSHQQLLSYFHNLIPILRKRHFLDYVFPLLAFRMALGMLDPANASQKYSELLDKDDPRRLELLDKIRNEGIRA